jgi:Fe-S-cluster containining protein
MRREIEMATYPIRLKLAEGSIETVLEMPDGPMRLVDLTFRMLGLSTAVSEMGEVAANQLGVTVSCTKGCGACCRTIIPLSPPEAILIYELVESMPEPRKSNIKKRFLSTVDQLKKQGLLKKLEDPSDPLLCKSDEEYFRQKIPCPFLENESCSIYEIRPSRCREYLVFTPPENCADPYHNKIGRLPISVRLNESLAWLWASMTKQKPRFIPLTLSMKWVQENIAIQNIAGDPKLMIETLCKLIEDIAAKIEQEALQNRT